MSLNPHALRALGLALAAILLLCLAGWGLQRCQQARQARTIERPAAAHAARLASQQAARLASDSTRLVRAGQTLEAHTVTTISRRQYDSLRALLPAALPALPAVPARPGH